MDEPSVSTPSESQGQHAASILESISDAFFALDRDWRFTYINARGELLLRRFRAELLGKNLWEEFPHAVGGTFDRVYHRAMDERVNSAFEEFSPRLNAWLAVRVVPYEAGIAVFLQDITERKVAEAERQERAAIIESSYDAVIGKNLDGMITSWNSSAERLYGYTRQEAVGQHISLIVPPERTDELRSIMESLRRGERIKRFETVRRHKDGSRVDVSVTISPIRNALGEVVGASTIAHDITAWKQAQAVMQAREARLNGILQSAMDAILSVDSDQRIILFNAAAERMFRCPASEALGTQLERFIPPRFRARHAEHIHRFGETGTTNRAMNALGALSGLRADGEEFPIEATISQVESEGQKIYTVIIRDITERHRAEEALRQEQERFTRIAATSPGVIFAFQQQPDGTACFPYASPGVQEIFGLSPEVLAESATPAFVRLHQEDWSHVQASIAESLQGMSLWNTVFRVQHPERGERWIEVHATPTCEADGSALWYGFLNDITERKQLEEQFLQAQKMEGIGRLAGGIAHDFNNLLAAILGYTELAEMELAEESAIHDYLANVTKAAERASGLTQQLLAFARKQANEPKVINLNALVQDIEGMLRRLIREDIELVNVLEEDLGAIRIDPSQFVQALINLAVNARDAMPNGGLLHIETSNVSVTEEDAATHVGMNPGAYVCLRVRDTGIGMNEEVQARLFEPFFTTKPVGKGTGLGLATSYGIIKQHGGHIFVKSAVGQGTTFTLYFPRVNEPVIPLSAPHAFAHLALGDESLLVVEDEPLVRGFAVQMLRSLNYVVFEASDGEEALQVLHGLGEKNHIDLLITDVIMPRMGGRELARHLHEQRPSLKVLYCSGYTDRMIVEHGVLEEGMAFLQKPYTPSALARKVRELLDS